MRPVGKGLRLAVSFPLPACEKIVLFLTFSAGSVLPRVLAALFDARRAEFSRQAGAYSRQKS